MFWLLKPDLYRRFPLECELMRLMHLFLAWTSHYTPEFCTHWCMHHPWICNSSPNSKKDNAFVLHFLMILVHHLKYTHCNFQIFCCFFKKNFLVNHRMWLWLHLRHEFGSSRFYTNSNMIEKWRQTFLAMKTQFNTFTPQEWMFYPCSDNVYLYLVRDLFVSHRTCTRVDSPILWCFRSSCDGQLPILRLSQPAKTKAYLYK